jgi:hypothetical protein
MSASVKPIALAGSVLEATVVCHSPADAQKSALCVFEEDIVRNVFKKGSEQISIELMAPIHSRSKKY